MSADLETPRTDPSLDFSDAGHEMAVLVPTPVATYCYLFEALLWVAMQRIPLALPWGDGTDCRISTEDMDSMEPRVEVDPLSDEECERLGLPSNPEYAEYLSGDYHSRPEHIEQILGLIGECAERAKFLDQLEMARLHYKAVEAWKQQFDEFVELPKSRLFIALREGKIRSAGKRLPLGPVASFPEVLPTDEWDQWLKEPWSEIPWTNWTFSGIDWDGCKANGRQAAYALILVSTEQLLAAFPPAPEPAGQAVRIGSHYRIEDGPHATRPSKRGRPAFDWDAFHIEMARRVKAGSLPKKQEALIADMQAWCASIWKRPVGRSTLLQKIQPYYSAFLRQSENAL